MAWFNSILGGGTSNPTPYVSPAAVPSGMMAATAATGTILQSNSTSSYWASAQAQTINTMEHMGKVQSLNSYANVIGWTLTHHHLPVGVTSDDPKIAILKITSVGEVLKDIGVRTSDTDYYIMREPSE